MRVSATLRNRMVCLMTFLFFVNGFHQSQAQQLTAEQVARIEEEEDFSDERFSFPKPQQLTLEQAARIKGRGELLDEQFVFPKIKKLNPAAAKNVLPVARFFKTVDADKKIEKALQSKMKVRFNNISFLDAVKYLEEYHKIKIVIDNNSSREDDPIDLYQGGISFVSDEILFEDILEHVLSFSYCDYYVANNRLVIASVTRVRQRMTTVVYDIRKLLAAGMREKRLARIIEIAVADNEGDEGNKRKISLSILPGCLVISQSYRSHKKTFQLLQQLEQVINRKGIISSVEKKQKTVSFPVMRLPTANKVSKKIEKVLKRKIKCKLLDTFLKEMIAVLQKQYQITIILDEETLYNEDLPIDLPVDRPMNFVADKIPLESALKSSLKPLHLGYYVENETIVITSFERLVERKITTMITVVYDVRKLIAAGMQISELRQVIRVAGTGLWSEYDDDEYREEEEGKVSMMSGCLVISQTDHSHKKIFDLLQQLERMIDSNKTAPSKNKATPPKTTEK